MHICEFAGKRGLISLPGVHRPTSRITQGSTAIHGSTRLRSQHLTMPRVITSCSSCPVPRGRGAPPHLGDLALGAIVGADLLGRRRSRPVRVVGAMCVASVVYYLSFFFLAMGFGFRWSWLVVVATVVGVLVDLETAWPVPALSDLFHSRRQTPKGRAD